MSVSSVHRAQVKAVFKRVTFPPPLVLVYIFTAMGFVIYIPVSILRSNIPLLLQDVLLFAALTMTMGGRPKRATRILGGSRLVLFFFTMYLFSVFFGVLVDLSTDVPLQSTIRGVRSLVFGMGFLILSSIWINSPKRAYVFFKIYLWGALIAALYGFRQLLFGLMPFELERLSLMGAVVQESATFGRTRISSTFGDPATFSFIMMSAMLMLPLIRQVPAWGGVIQRHYWIVLGLLCAGLLLSFARIPMVALAVALMFLFIIKRRLITTKVLRLASLTAAIVVLVFALNYLVFNRVLVQYDNKLIRVGDAVLSSVWSVLPATDDIDLLPWRVKALKVLSGSRRKAAWGEGLNYLFQNPLGVGIGKITEGGQDAITFSPVDVGVLRFGLEVGILGFVAVLGLWFSVAWVAYRKMKRVSDRHTLMMGRQLFALWVAFSVALLGNAYLHVEILSATVWAVGGILLNLDVIAENKKIFITKGKLASKREITI